MVWMLVCICMHVLCAWEFVLLCVCVFLCVRVCLYQNISRLNRRTLSSGPTYGRGYYLGRCMLKEETKSKFSFLYRLTSFNILDRVHPEVCNFVIYILLLFLKSPWYCRLQYALAQLISSMFYAHILSPSFHDILGTWNSQLYDVTHRPQTWWAQLRGMNSNIGTQNTDLFSTYRIVF